MTEYLLTTVVCLSPALVPVKDWWQDAQCSTLLPVQLALQGPQAAAIYSAGVSAWTSGAGLTALMTGCMSFMTIERNSRWTLVATG